MGTGNMLVPIFTHSSRLRKRRITYYIIVLSGL
jgi:hypothetical protein